MDIKPFLHEHYLLNDCYDNEEASCDICHQQIDGLAYSCESCPNFWLHASCAEEQLPPQISHPLHTQHLLTLRNICRKKIWAKRKDNIFYRCVQCNFNFHFGCLEISSVITHKYHRHDLILVKRFEEDDSAEYYCDICEEQRNENDPIYCCKECTFIFHIQCALNKVGSEALIPKLREQEETE
ncbi:uncharacterized protein LOC110415619, partial [Herrania umbratica]|uniref:Uncharacterized protein LOC110415619 n=1 Tax=Herrania umbratica TaxID=108875 RepID=A0A6J1A772_9ROSI